MPGTVLADESLYIQVCGHPVTGYAAWKEMADGMTSAPKDAAPPHMALIKEFWLGPEKMPYTVKVCHVIDSKDKLEQVSALFAPGSDFMKGFQENPVVKDGIGSMEWNQFEVKIVHNQDVAIEDGMVLGVYAHGVPDMEKWYEAFNGPDADKIHVDMGIVKSFGGKVIHTTGRKSAFLPDETKPVAMVIHAFKTLDDKNKFDMMFDPTNGFFKAMIEAGGASGPFQSQSLGPLFKHCP